jgi:hypothetical protein
MEQVTLEEALVIAKEIGESLGGRQQRALEVLSRHAQRSQRQTGSNTAIQAFRNATEIAKSGLDEPSKE